MDTKRYRIGSDSVYWPEYPLVTLDAVQVVIPYNTHLYITCYEIEAKAVLYLLGPELRYMELVAKLRYSDILEIEELVAKLKDIKIKT